jgi:hypothetical protein
MSEIKITNWKDVEFQRANVEKGNPPVNLVAPCRNGDGIIQLSSEAEQHFLKRAKMSRKSMAFFIPASGSGSRMFRFLYEYLQNPNDETTAPVEYFLNSFDQLAMSEYLPEKLKYQMKKGDFDLEEVLTFILEQHGMNLGGLPKALIPFHKITPFVLNPIQAQLIQGQRIHPNIEKFHFTIQEGREIETQESVHYLKKMSGFSLDVEYSFQSKDTDVVTFNDKLETAMDEDGEVIHRPAGHGALLANLERVKEDYILIKNIDNIQHWDHHHASEKAWQVLVGIMQEVQSDIFGLIQDFNINKFHELNQRFQIFHKETVANMSDKEILALLERPIRVCGMVRNIGQPGGGPFWVKDGETISKQIVEKSQISNDDKQRKLMIRSTHFNPVMMVVSRKDRAGNFFELDKFLDPNKYFVVEKSHKREKIKYCELPGLWNGSMAFWNTLFIEVPNDTFSPVKSLLDLLHPMHQPQIKR